MGEIKVHMRVTTAFGAAALDGLNVSAADLQKRRNGVEGTVDSQIAGTDGQGFWVILDDITSKFKARPLRRMRQQEDADIKEIVARRDRRAPYFAAELTRR